MDKEKNDDAISATQKTSDYTIFKKMDGNREVLPGNVRQLVRSMVDNGNLTQNVPVLVNEHMEVVDGQHRLAALQQLGWPVYYRIEEGLGLSVVQALNNAGRNWSWKDYASSHAAHIPDYQKFLDLANEFGIGFGVVIMYCGENDSKSRNRTATFNAGDFRFKSYERTKELLQIAGDITSMIGLNRATLWRAIYKVLNRSDIDLKRLVHKVELFGSQIIKPVVGEEDYLREIEDCYNYKVEEANRARLF
jgi:hypothetical protein